MTSLNGEDGASDGEVGLVLDVGSGTEVGGHTNGLEDASDAQERIDIGDAEASHNLPSAGLLKVGRGKLTCTCIP